MPTESLASLIQFVGEAPSAIAMFDRDMRYMMVSERWKSDFNLHQDLIGLLHYDVSPEITEDWKAVHRRALAGETVRAALEAFQRLDGSTQWLQWVVSPWLGPDSAVGGVVISSFNLPEPAMEQAQPAPGLRDQGLIARERRAIIGELRTANLMLNHIADPLFELLADHLTPFVLEPEMVLAEPQQAIGRVYFPLGGLVSMIRRLGDGSSAEVVGGGRGGFVGVSVVAGDPFEETEVRVLVRGSALVIRSDRLRKIMALHPDLRTALMRFNSMLMAQMSVSVSCMARHNLDQRLARWLLTASQRLGAGELDVRQESLAQILGVRRTGISEAMGRLIAAGAIGGGRARIVILDRAGLEARSCDCFWEAEAARRRVAPSVEATPPPPPGRLQDLFDRYSALAQGQG